MNLIKKAFCVCGAAALMFTSCEKDDTTKPITLGDKEGILLVTFGSTYEAPQATFNNMDKAAKTKYAGEEIRWGYTSTDILNKLRKGLGENGIQKDNDTPEEAMTQMVKDGYAKFNVQSLHVIPGEEYDELLEANEKVEKEFPGVEIVVGKPLLDSDEDIKVVAKILANKFNDLVTMGPVLFMGHGTPHAADDRYLKLDAELKKLNANFFVGTVEGIGFDAGTTSIGAIVTKLQALTPQPTSVTITPLMSIAGDHANNDMNGNTGEIDVNEQSWRERLVGAGYTVNSVMKGLGDYDEINQIWLNHLEAVKIK
ncbi:sirohydrochlorin cobaltochelatase [Labilibacter marinus]|uniref:sirohydrochlorin cobaltochelatase n=1 Tax=Labilibacter marinus TaxID=1477105 RepID=UPI0009FB2A68|nr:sirohydrochlorin cobaltochelatase [Labilibacter marinus]